MSHSFIAKSISIVFLRHPYHRLLLSNFQLDCFFWIILLFHFSLPHPRYASTLTNHELHLTFFYQYSTWVFLLYLYLIIITALHLTPTPCALFSFRLKSYIQSLAPCLCSYISKYKYLPTLRLFASILEPIPHLWVTLIPENLQQSITTNTINLFPTESGFSSQNRFPVVQTGLPLFPAPQPHSFSLTPSCVSLLSRNLFN